MKKAPKALTPFGSFFVLMGILYRECFNKVNTTKCYIKTCLCYV